jgi:Tfp pilus assembly protein PilZ
MQHERRQYPRVKRTLRLSMQKRTMLFMRGQENMAEIADVSRSGARINTRVDLKVGEKVVLVLRPKTMRAKLEFNAQVVWTRPMSTDKGRFLQAGARFLAVSAEQSSVLFRFAVDQLQDE